VVAATIAAAVVLFAQLFGTLQDRDSLPLSQQRHEYMDQMIQFMRTNVGPNELIFTDQATSLQLRHYLCNQKPVAIDGSPDGLEEFRCDGFHVGFTGPNFGALDPDNMHRLRRDLDHWSSPSDHVWVVQGGWASGLGETLQRWPTFAQLDVHAFGKYLEIFRFPTRVPGPPQG
jgi:hypothetical protein